MNLLFAILLGIVQGIAEFLPISSSGHLVIAQALLMQFSSQPLPQWLQGMTMNVALHFGTLLSITVVYRRELLAAVRQPRLLLQLILASIPVAIIGLGFKDALEATFNSPLAAGCCLLVTAGILLVARRLQSGSVPIEQLSFRSSLIIGVFQAVAILPGISRAGSTVGAGLMCGLKGSEAARFSFSCDTGYRRGHAAGNAQGLHTRRLDGTGVAAAAGRSLCELSCGNSQPPLAHSAAEC
jgi:undecaprenyl-diphosphatase